MARLFFRFFDNEAYHFESGLFQISHGPAFLQKFMQIMTIMYYDASSSKTTLQFISNYIFIHKENIHVKNLNLFNK